MAKVDSAVAAAVTNPSPPSPPTGVPGPRPGRRRRRARRQLLVAGLPSIVILLLAIFGPLIVPYDAVATDTSIRLRPPLSELPGGGFTWLGTDQLGRDLLAQTIQGARVSMLVGACTIVIAGGFGVLVGTLAGYRRGWLDTVVGRLADMQLAFPSILLAILIAAVLGPSVTNVIITLAATRWVFFARVARSAALSIKSRDYVDASRVLGAPQGWILRRDVLPGMLTPLMILATLEFGAVIVAEASLSFLGLGSPVSTPSWGLTIADGRDYLDTAWWISTIPGIALALLMVSIGRVGDRLRDYLDPMMRVGR